MWSYINYNVLQYVFRDGVSEGQFYQVLLYELDAIRKVPVENNSAKLLFLLMWHSPIFIFFLCIGLCILGT